MRLVSSTRSEWSKGIMVLETFSDVPLVNIYSNFVGNRTSGRHEILSNHGVLGMV